MRGAGRKSFTRVPLGEGLTLRWRERPAGRAPRSGPCVPPPVPRVAGGAVPVVGASSRRAETRTARGSSGRVLRAGGTGGSHGWGVTAAPLLGAEPLCELLAGLVDPVSLGAIGSGRGDHSRAAGDCERGTPIRDPHAPGPVARSPLSGGGG